MRTCEAAIAGLEGVDDITDKYNIEFVKLNNKKYARNLGIRFEKLFNFFRILKNLAQSLILNFLGTLKKIFKKLHFFNKKHFFHQPFKTDKEKMQKKLCPILVYILIQAFSCSILL